MAIFLSDWASRIWGEKDPSKVVADEIVGYMTAMVALPFSWKLAWAGFFLFRVMDVLKPFPIRKIDRQWPGGWGIVLDDVLAGVYTHIILRMLMVLGLV
jgi:phosphatidylglycerophosphatase A